MNVPPFVADDIDALVFDVIGTLVDEDATFETAARQIAAVSGSGVLPGLHARWSEVLDRRMSDVIDGTADWQPHRELVSSSAEEAIVSLGGRFSAEIAAMVSSLDREYPAWPDVAEATRTLCHDRLVAGVSNGDLDSLARLAATNHISWHVALSTGAARTFKPAPAAYRYAIDTLGIDPTRTLFVAAHPWDLRAAAEHGFRTAFIGRPAAEHPSAEDRFDLEADDLQVLCRLLGTGTASER
jgi:2-haloacid dehalogenase